MFGGQSGIAGHLNIGKQVQMGGATAVTGNVRDGKVLFGYPAIEHAKFARCNAVYRNLPDMFKELNELKKEVEILKQQLADHC